MATFVWTMFSIEEMVKDTCSGRVSTAILKAKTGLGPEQFWQGPNSYDCMTWLKACWQGKTFAAMMAAYQAWSKEGQIMVSQWILYSFLGLKRLIHFARNILTILYNFSYFNSYNLQKPVCIIYFYIASSPKIKFFYHNTSLFLCL